jgi:DeoR family transcriptional regulator, glycerol-3-phosphate regulon repressor
MRKSARQHRILAEFGVSPTVRISNLADAFGVSTETIRRDIDELTRKGLVDRTYGGAAIRHIGYQPDLGAREQIAVEERRRIARAAAALVKPGDVLMIDSGTTTTEFARVLAASAKDLTVITNSIGAALALGAGPARVVLCPGDVSGRERGVYGPETIAFLTRFHADLAVIGASGLTAEGPTEVESRASWVKRSMLDRARRRVLLVDGTKFDEAGLEVVCPLARLGDLVTDRRPEGALAAALETAGVTVHLA